MTAFYDPAATKEQETLTAIFNSFRLLGENSDAEGPAKSNLSTRQSDPK
jgi:hypothetical protein